MLRCSDISRNTALLQICGSRFRLGATGTNPSIPATTCYCGQHVQGSDIDHAMTCPKLSGSHSRRHDDWKYALSRVTARAGYSNRKPGYNEVGTAAPGRASSRAEIEARLPPPHGPALLDVSVTPTSCHLRNRCSYHTRVCSGETRCLEISGSQRPLSSRLHSHSCLCGNIWLSREAPSPLSEHSQRGGYSRQLSLIHI